MFLCISCFKCITGEALHKFQFLPVLEFPVQGVHIVRKVCIDKGETTSGKIKRDSVEPSSAKVQGVHRRELSFEFVEKIKSLRILENSVRRALSWCKCAQKELFSSSEKREVVEEKTLTGF
jgi:hypothetical protein